MDSVHAKVFYKYESTQESYSNCPSTPQWYSTSRLIDIWEKEQYKFEQRYFFTWIIKPVFAQDHNFGADDRPLRQTLSGRHLCLLSSSLGHTLGSCCCCFCCVIHAHELFLISFHETWLLELLITRERETDGTRNYVPIRWGRTRGLYAKSIQDFKYCAAVLRKIIRH